MLDKILKILEESADLNLSSESARRAIAKEIMEAICA
jgi:hypothetical protein